MGIREKLNPRFAPLQGGLFLNVTKADVGEGTGNFQKTGGDVMAWADPFYPDPAIPESVKKAMMEALESGIPAHYTMPIGMLELRQALAQHITEATGLPIDPSRNVIVTPGSDSGLLYAMMPFLNEGDEVMVPDPSYPSNFLNPTLLGAVTVPVPLREEDNYQPNIEEFRKRLTPKTKMVLITHPNNPTTTVFRREAMEELCRFIVENDLILVSDQAFQDHIFDGIEFVHPAALPGMWERTLTVCSISKGIGLSGFRIGYIYADDAIMDTLYGGAVNVLGAGRSLYPVLDWGHRRPEGQATPGQHVHPPGAPPPDSLRKAPRHPWREYGHARKRDPFLAEHFPAWHRGRGVRPLAGRSPDPGKPGGALRPAGKGAYPHRHSVLCL